MSNHVHYTSNDKHYICSSDNILLSTRHTLRHWIMIRSQKTSTACDHEMLKFLRSSFCTCLHKTTRARAHGARGLKVWNVEETHTESHKKIWVDSVNGSHRNSTWKRGDKSGHTHRHAHISTDIHWFVYGGLVPSKKIELIRWLETIVWS